MAGLVSPLPAALGADTSSVLPSLRGVVIEGREDDWKVDIQETLSSKEYRSSWQVVPRQRYDLRYDFLRSDSTAEFQTLAGWFAMNGGRLNSWLFSDPDDSSVTAHPFGVGDGTARVFQLQRTLMPSTLLPAAAGRTYWPYFGSGYRPVYDLNGAASIYKDALLQATPANYTIDSQGVVTFAAAPGVGSILTWTGTYYWRVRFDGSLSLRRVVRLLWQGSSVPLVTVKP